MRTTTRFSHTFALIFSIILFGLCFAVDLPPDPPAQPRQTTRIDRMTEAEVKQQAPLLGTFYESANCWVPEGRDSCAPWFVVAGSMKCGTTSVYSYLLNHPAMLPISPEAKLNNKAILALKEIRFFNDPTYVRMVNKDENGAFKEYLDIFEHIPPPNSPVSLNKGKITGEASPMYVCQRGVAKRTFYTLPYAKVLIFIRNPVDRMYSEFWFRQFLSKSGSGATQKSETDMEKWQSDMIRIFETCADVEMSRYKFCGIDEFANEPTMDKFDEVVTCMGRVNSQVSRAEFCVENPRLCVPQNSKKSCMNNNVKNSLYITQIREWFDMYDRDQLLVVRSEDLYRNTSQIMTQVTSFLNLPPFDWEVVADYAYNIVNPGTKSADNHVLVTENRAGLFIGGTNSENTHNYPDLPEDTKQKLEEFFAPFNKLLADLLGRPKLW